MKIKVTKNGPYLVTGAVPLAVQGVLVDAEGNPQEWQEGKKYLVDDCYALCRCGKSSNKPFCDGTHELIPFDGAETAGNVPFVDQAYLYDGSHLTLLDAEKYCSRARFCHRAGGTWQLTIKSRRPEARQEAIKQACHCPSGRLVAVDKEDKVIEAELAKSIGVVEDTPAGCDGPLWVRGGIPIVSETGETYELRNRVTLCRCGRSSNKPFCDGSHLE